MMAIPDPPVIWKPTRRETCGPQGATTFTTLRRLILQLLLRLLHLLHLLLRLGAPTRVGAPTLLLLVGARGGSSIVLASLGWSPISNAERMYDSRVVSIVSMFLNALCSDTRELGSLRVDNDSAMG